MKLFVLSIQRTDTGGYRVRYQVASKSREAEFKQIGHVWTYSNDIAKFEAYPLFRQLIEVLDKIRDSQSVKLPLELADGWPDMPP